MTKINELFARKILSKILMGLCRLKKKKWKQAFLNYPSSLKKVRKRYENAFDVITGEFKYYCSW